MSRCIHVYPFVARNHGGIPFSGVCPLFFSVLYKICISSAMASTSATRVDLTGAMLESFEDNASAREIVTTTKDSRAPC